jgi:LDH2 family malate/lactate/ureidoglycolate dehydrogenase
MKKGINLVTGYQRQWRAGREDPQASWVVEDEGPTSAQSKDAPYEDSTGLFRFSDFIP